MSDEAIKSPITSDNSLAPGIDYFDNSKIEVKFDGSCLRQVKVTFAYRKIVNIYIVEEISFWIFRRDANFSLANASALFGSGKLTKNPDKDKYKYSNWVRQSCNLLIV